MNRRILSIFAWLIPCLLLSSCSGLKQPITCSGTCVNNNGTVSFVLTATPPDPNSQLSIQAFTATITGITLTPSSGNPVSVPLNTSTYIAEFNRVTSDSTILAAGASIPAATYTQATISFSAPTVTFCTQVNLGVAGCAAGTLTSISGSASSATASINLSLGANQQTGIAINVNLANALTLNSQTITLVNLAANNVFSAAILPPASTATDLAAGQLSHIDDVMGTITNVGANLLTIHTTTRGDIVANANSSTQYSSSCSANSFSCVKANDVAIIDAILNTDGTFTVVFYDLLVSGSTDLIEGVVTGVPDSVNNKLTVAVTDSVFANSGSVLNSQLHIGDQVTVTLASPQPFTIVSKGLTSLPFSSFNNSTSIADVQPGMTVAFPVTAYVAQSGVTPGTTTTNTFLLRFTRVSGVVTAIGAPDFLGNTLPPYLGLTIAEQFQTTSGRLSLDGISSLGGLPVGNTFSSSALYLGSSASPSFASQTVRAH